MTDRDTTILKSNRILVALDTSARGRAALAVAVRLASSMSAELQGLFVEDEDLVRLASLPFAREVDVASAASRELRSVSMERALRASAEEAQSVFANALQQLNLQWTFRIVRGGVTHASLAAAGDVDLLVIGQQGRSPHIMVGDYLPKRLGNDKSVVAVFDGSPSAFRTLELANRLTDPSCPRISVLVLTAYNDEVAKQCMSWLQQKDIRAEVYQVSRSSEDALLDYVRKWPPSVLLVNRDSGLINDSQICRLVNEFECPLILC